MEILIAINQEIITFAQSKGWTEKVTQKGVDPVHGTVLVEVDNPITKEQFVSDYFKNIVVAEFANQQLGIINQDLELQRKAQIEALQTSLSEVINVDAK